MFITVFLLIIFWMFRSIELKIVRVLKTIIRLFFPNLYLYTLLLSYRSTLSYQLGTIDISRMKETRLVENPNGKSGLPKISSYSRLFSYSIFSVWSVHTNCLVWMFILVSGRIDVFRSRKSNRFIITKVIYSDVTLRNLRSVFFLTRLINLYQW